MGVLLGVEIYILLGLHVQPQLLKVQPQCMLVQTQLGKDHLLAHDRPKDHDSGPKMVHCQLSGEIFRPKMVFHQPERPLCWSGRPFVGTRGPFVGL